jgi:tetratricopeptide (TPR) repeat protein
MVTKLLEWRRFTRCILCSGVALFLAISSSASAQPKPAKTYSEALDLALSYLTARQTTEARGYLKQALDLAASEEERINVIKPLALADGIDGKYEDEREKLDQVLASKVVPDSTKQVAQFQKAQSFINQKRWEEARKEYAKILTFGEVAPQMQLLVHQGTAVSFRREEKYDEARAELDKIQAIVDVTPSIIASGLLQRGQTFVDQKRYDEARVEYNKVITFPTTDVEDEEAREVRSTQAVAQFRIAGIFFEQKEFAQAREEYEKVLEMDDVAPFFVAEAKKQIMAIDEALKPKEQPEEQPK